MVKQELDIDLGKESLVGIFGRTVLLTGGFIEVVVLARFLSPATVGTLYFLLAGSQVLSQLIDGTTVAIRKRVSETGTGVAEYLGCGLLLAVGYGLFLFTLTALGYTVLNVRPVTVSRPLAFAVVAVVLTLSVFVVVNDTYAGTGHPGGSMLTNASRTLLRLVVEVTILSVGGSVVHLLLGIAFANLACALGVATVVGVRPRVPTRATIESILTFAKYSVPNSFFQRLYSRVDVILLGLLASSTAAGFYEMALRLTIPAGIVPAALGRSLTVKSSNLSFREKDDLIDTIENSFRYAGVLTFPLLFGVLVLGKPILSTVYTAAYTEAWPALVGLALFQVVNAYRSLYVMLVDGIDYPKLNFRINAYTIVAFVPLAIYATREYGLVGIVTATILIECVRLGAYTLTVQRRVEVIPFDWAVLEQATSATFMATVLVLVREYVVAIESPVAVFALVLGGGATYFAGLTVVSERFRVDARVQLKTITDVW